MGSPAPFDAAPDDPQARLHVPDGLCVDDRSRLYVASNSTEVSAIVVFAAISAWLGGMLGAALGWFNVVILFPREVKRSEQPPRL